ncbi:MAG: zinc ribbon domain-containing protein [Verrucomicrobia bacterium]|nr:zinc ribbon domain-containing protein [Verrucomicrobiota bacterium]
MARDVCPNCGAELPKKARACPECGSDEQTGWSDDAHAGGIDLPEEDFNYDEFVKNEFSSERDIKPRGLHWFWWMTGVVLIIGVIFWLFGRVF